jgi:hypothetical protein
LDNCEQLPNFIKKFRRLKNQLVRNFLAALQEFAQGKKVARSLGEGREERQPVDDSMKLARNQMSSVPKIAKALK